MGGMESSSSFASKPLLESTTFKSTSTFQYGSIIQNPVDIQHHSLKKEDVKPMDPISKNQLVQCHHCFKTLESEKDTIHSIPEYDTCTDVNQRKRKVHFSCVVCYEWIRMDIFESMFQKDLYLLASNSQPSVQVLRTSGQIESGWRMECIYWKSGKDSKDSSLVRDRLYICVHHPPKGQTKCVAASELVLRNPEMFEKPLQLVQLKYDSELRQCTEKLNCDIQNLLKEKIKKQLDESLHYAGLV